MTLGRLLCAWKRRSGYRSDQLSGRSTFTGARLVPVLTSILPSLLTAFPALAQQPPPERPTAILVGVVRDAPSGTAVPGASVAVVDRPLLFTFADSLGRFRLPGVPTGPRVLRVQRLGYADLLEPVTVTGTPAPLELLLEPSPIEIPGIAVTARADLSLSGVVLDASSGAGVPWASLWFRRVDRRAAADAKGSFRVGRIPAGSHLLLIERWGYVSQYVQVAVGLPPEPVVIRLDPDPVLLEGITVITSRFTTRRNAFPFAVRAYGEDRLNRSASRDVFDFLRNEAAVMFTSCPPRQLASYCLVRRGQVIQPKVFIDEMPIFCGLDVLITYQPQDLYLIEVYGGGAQIRAYTHGYVERVARRPQQLIPADLPSSVGC